MYHVYVPTAVTSLKSSYQWCSLKFVLVRHSYTVFLNAFIWNYPTFIPLIRTTDIIYLCSLVSVRVGGSLENYQPMGLCCLLCSLAYYVWQVDQYSETKSKISCHLSPTLEITGYCYHSGDLQFHFKQIWCWLYTFLPRVFKRWYTYVFT